MHRIRSILLLLLLLLLSISIASDPWGQHTGQFVSFAFASPKPIRRQKDASKAHKHASKPLAAEGEKGVVNIRGTESLELNCPSISYKFPEHSTLRCESCKTMGRVLHYAIVHYFREPEDMLISGPTQRGPELCVMASLVSELRQKTNGRRFWDLTRLMKAGDLIEHSPYVDHDYDPLPEAHKPDTRKREIEKARAAGHGEFKIEDPTDYPTVATNDKAISVNNRRVTYHTEEERETLPCANFFLNRYCLTEYLGEDDTADAVEGCVNTYKAVRKSQEAAVSAAAKRRLAELKEAAGGATVGTTLAELEAEERARVDMSPASQRLSTSLLNCLTGKICGSLHRNECDTRQLIEMQKGERDAFLRYEAKYGNKENPFVGTALDARKLERNPYASKASHSGDL